MRLATRRMPPVGFIAPPLYKEGARKRSGLGPRFLRFFFFFCVAFGGVVSVRCVGGFLAGYPRLATPG